MPTTISDNRQYLAMTAEDADQLMAEIAQLEIEEEAEKAAAECRIARIKAERETREAAAECRIRYLAARLDGYIQAHAREFDSPRARVTDWGKYGMRDVTSTIYRDKEALLERLKLAGRNDLLKITISLDTTAISRAVASGEKIDGVERVSGERTFYKTAKALIDKAVEHAKRG